MQANTIGRKLPRARPVILTFYDSLKDYPYTSTFSVRDDATNEQIQHLINCVCALSDCVLGQYKIGYAVYVIPDLEDKVKALKSSVMGTFKWRITYRTPHGMSRSHTIPGLNRETSLRMTKNIMKSPGKDPDLSHPKWRAFLEIFRAICVTKGGEAIHEPIMCSYSGGNWPPKGAKRRR